MDNVNCTFDDNGNLLSDGTNTYSYDSANRLIAISGQQSASYTYNGLGDRLSQTVNSETTNYTLDMNSGLTQVLDDEVNSYTYGLGRISQLNTDTLVTDYFLGDALGSVRQITNSTGDITLAKSYDPYGNMTHVTGNAQTQYGFTGEVTDSTGNIYLRARYYSPNDGRFMSRDMWGGNSKSPMSMNRWNYTESNPVNYVDPSGYAPTLSGFTPTCPIISGGHSWDCSTVVNVLNLKFAFLDSAKRHNRIPGMDTNGFAALLASTMIGERRLGNQNQNNFWRDLLEDAGISLGCISSGHLILDALEKHNWPKFFDLLVNNPDINLGNVHLDEIVGFASVGIGNIKLKTAADLWNGQTCRFDGVCTSIEVSRLQYVGWLNETKVKNPFDDQIFCFENCVVYPPTKVQSYQILANQLIDRRINIEYLAANFEAAALRAISIGEIPTAFNTVAWHTKGVQTDAEILLLQNSIGGSVGHADWVLDDIGVALQALGLTSTWSVNNEPQYRNHP